MPSGINKNKVIIGLPAKNEATSIFEALKSIGEAADYAGTPYQIVVCINGCTDDTAGQVKKFILYNPRINCSLINSRPGLVNAQRKIVETFPATIYVFPDADGKIERKSIKLLLDELHQRPELIVAYARTVSLDLPSKKKTLAEKIGWLYDYQKLLTPREYFHGRLFAIKNWSVPDNNDIRKRAMASRANRQLLKYCSNNILLSADDIYLSSYIIDRYGLNAIKQVSEANCYSWPISSFRDWHNVYRRRNIEMEKMRRWFPEYNYLWPHLNRRTDWQKWWRADWPDKLIWLAYLSMKAVFFFLLRGEFFLLHFNFFHPSGQWKTTLSTKKRAKRLFFFDLDDTLIDPKNKKLSRLKTEIVKYQKLGDVLGINTNRPWPESKDIYSSLELNGPIICEGGSYFKLNFGAKEKIMPSAEKKLKNKIIEFINWKYGRNKTNIIVSNNKKILLDKNIDSLVFITANRQFSASIYARKSGCNNRHLLLSLARDIKCRFPGYAVNLSIDKSKITIDNPRVNKFAAMSYLMKRYFADYKIFMVSNNENIIGNWPNITFCATMNGSASYKNKCLYSATKAGEDGLIQILNNCL